MIYVWKFLGSLIAALLSFFLIRFVVGPMLATTYGALVASVVVGALVWALVAVWELQRAITTIRRFGGL